MFIQTVPSLVLMCRAFPPLCEDVTALLVQIARVCRSQLAINSNTAVTGKQRVHVPGGSCMTYCVCVCVHVYVWEQERARARCVFDQGFLHDLVYAWESWGGGGDQGFLHDLVYAWESWGGGGGVIRGSCMTWCMRERAGGGVWSGVPAWPGVCVRELGGGGGDQGFLHDLVYAWESWGGGGVTGVPAWPGVCVRELGGGGVIRGSCMTLHVRERAGCVWAGVVCIWVGVLA